MEPSEGLSSLWPYSSQRRPQEAARGPGGPEGSGGGRQPLCAVGVSEELCGASGFADGRLGPFPVTTARVTLIGSFDLLGLAEGCGL